MYNVVIADDHTLVSNAIRDIVEGFDSSTVLYEVRNGRELLHRFKDKKSIPDLVLLDINMPIMDGFSTMSKLHQLHPDVFVLCLTMNDKKESFIKMIELGAHGFLSKVAEKSELELAIKSVLTKGCYYTPDMADILFRAMSTKTQVVKDLLSDREKELLTYVCTEMTYHSIADEMCLSPKTIDGYRDSLFQKLNIKSRVGLAMYAAKNGYFDL